MMPRTVSPQPTSYVLRITLTGGTRGDKTIAKVVNRNTRHFKDYVADLNSVVANLADLSSDGTKNGSFSGFSNNDVIEIRCHGGRIGSAVHTVDTAAGRRGNSVTVTVIDVTATTNPVLSI